MKGIPDTEAFALGTHGVNGNAHSASSACPTQRSGLPPSSPFHLILNYNPLIQVLFSSLFHKWKNWSSETFRLLVPDHTASNHWQFCTLSLPLFCKYGKYLLIKWMSEVLICQVSFICQTLWDFLSHYSRHYYCHWKDLEKLPNNEMEWFIKIQKEIKC